MLAKHPRSMCRRIVSGETGDLSMANVGDRNDMLDREHMAIVDNDQMELEALAECHLASKEKRRRKTDAGGSGASSSRNINALLNETQGSVMRFPDGVEGQREREGTRCWKPSLKILRAEVPNQVPHSRERKPCRYVTRRMCKVRGSICFCEQCEWI